MTTQFTDIVAVFWTHPIKRNWRRTLTLSLLCAGLIGCAVPIDPDVPGMDRKSSKLDVNSFKLSTVITATRCEIAKALQTIRNTIIEDGVVDDKGKWNPKPDSVYNSFQIYNGTLTFTGKTEIIRTDKGAISVVLPLGTSTLTPNYGSTAKGTATQTIERTFQIEFDRVEHDTRPGVPNHISIAVCSSPSLINFNSSSFLSKAIEQQFRQLTKGISEGESQSKQPGPKKKPGPKLRNIQMSIEVSFVFTKSPTGGAEVEVLFNNPSLKSIGPGFTLSEDTSNTYSVKVVFPLKKDESSGESRLSLHCFHSIGGHETQCIERTLTGEDLARYITLSKRNTTSLSSTEKKPDTQSGGEATQKSTPPVPTDGSSDRDVEAAELKPDIPLHLKSFAPAF